MKGLGLVVSDKKIFENCILKTYFLTPWPTYATNWNLLNNFDRGPPRDHSCEVWSKSNKRFQRRCCLKKLLTDAGTHGRTDNGRRTLKDHKSSLSTLCSGELKTFSPLLIFLFKTDMKTIEKTTFIKKQYFLELFFDHFSYLSLPQGMQTRWGPQTPPCPCTRARWAACALLAHACPPRCQRWPSWGCTTSSPAAHCGRWGPCRAAWWTPPVPPDTVSVEGEVVTTYSETVYKYSNVFYHNTYIKPWDVSYSAILNKTRWELPKQEGPEGPGTLTWDKRF